MDLPPLVVGPLRKDGLVASRTGQSLPYPLLGMDVFKEHRLEYLFAEGCVVVNGDVRPLPSPPLTTSPASHPLVRVAIGDAETLAVWDTDASMTVVDLKVVAQHPAHFAPAGGAVGTDSGGASASTTLYTMTGAAVGGAGFAPHAVAAADLSRLSAHGSPLELVLGYTTLSQVNWVFDFPARRWAVLSG